MLCASGERRDRLHQRPAVGDDEEQAEDEEQVIDAEQDVFDAEPQVPCDRCQPVVTAPRVTEGFTGLSRWLSRRPSAWWMRTMTSVIVDSRPSIASVLPSMPPSQVSVPRTTSAPGVSCCWPERRGGTPSAGSARCRSRSRRPTASSRGSCRCQAPSPAARGSPAALRAPRRRGRPRPRRGARRSTARGSSLHAPGDAGGAGCGASGRFSSVTW